MLVCEFYTDYIYSVLFTIDQDTGRILNDQTYYDVAADVYLNDVAYTSTGTAVVAGSKYGEFSAEIPVTKQTGSTTGTIVILRSAVTGNPYSWQIGGTGIDPFENLLYVERYTGLTGTVRQGSGATFDIIDNGNGTYSAGIVSGGTNYLPGHKIKILGSAIGGIDVTNDIIITVQSAPSGVIDGVGNTGTAAGTGTNTYSALTGTNYLVGSGFELTFESSRYSNNYGNYWSFNVTNQGTNYVDNDVIVIPGTSLGGTSPANDLTWTAQVSGGGVISYNSSPQGTSQSTTWKLETYTQVDFGGSGSWSITYPLSRENFLATPTWQRTFGTNGDQTDRAYALAVDSADNIIVVGQGYGVVDAPNTDDLATVWLFTSSGSDEWVKQLNEQDDDCRAMSVVTIGTDIYVTHDSNYDDETVISKLDTSGTVKWQRRTDSSDDSVIARTPDGNLLVAVEAYNEDIGDNALKIIKLASNGEVIYKRWLFATTDDDTNFKNGRGLATDATSFYITGYFYGNDYDSAFAARLPLDGSGTGEYGSFRYTDVNPMDGSFNDDGFDLNYDVSEVDLTTGFAGDLTVAPYMNTATTVLNASGDFYVNWFNSGWTLVPVRDTDGGNIVFADGTTQNTSATDTPQRRYVGQKYTIGLQDRGHHILCNNSNDEILIPYNARVEFPIGTTITIVNMDNGSVYVYTEGGSTSLMVAGNYNGYTSSAQVFGCGVGTLIKVGREQWVLYGNVDTY
jgi:hypothetical protein